MNKIVTTTLNKLLEAIAESPDGPEIGAIFDFDGTLIAGFSATVFIKEQLRRGDLSARDFVEISNAIVGFGFGKIGFSAMMLVNAQFVRGISEQHYREFGEELYTKHIARLIYPESRMLVDAHLAKGHTVAVISSATPYQVEPAARDLGIKHVLCSQLEVENGNFTGGVVRPTCFGQGKVDAAEKLARQQRVNLDASFFYSDSQDDIELLQRVGRPQPLNPNKKLAKTALQRGWPIVRFVSRGRPSVAEFVRSVGATVSLVPTFIAGLPVYALTGSKREAQNFSFSLFADTASALIGLKLNVKGEENLWKQRPAVFVFNHQSKADVIIAARLLRRDIAGVGKQEIRKIPVLGKVMEFGGMVMIDRANASSAIEAMAPLIDAMRDEGKSVVLAPEGTRSVSPRLAPFKKGAFHLALQAGVPVVPIVIRNAGDVAPKGDFVFRAATVDVEVLPPVDTSSWKAETMDLHVAEVRGMFIKALGQDRPAAPVLNSRVIASAKAKPKPKPKAKAKAKAKAKPITKSRSKASGKTKVKAKAKATAQAKTKAKAKAERKISRVAGSDQARR